MGVFIAHMSLTNRIRDVFYKAPSVIFELSTESEAKMRDPKWELAELYDRAESSWALQQLYRVIISEVKRPGWDVKFKFKKKCNVCGVEFNEAVDECEICKSDDLREPDAKHLQKARKLLKTPNSHRQSFGDILGSIIYHDLVADDWYISVSYAPVKSLKTWAPKEIFVEDPRYFKVVSDDRGRIGSKEWFCPICYPEKDGARVYDKEGRCAKCKTPLKNTAYVQKISGDITNRMGVDQAVHGSTYRILPYIYGAPRLVSVWELVWTLAAMDGWFFDTYQTGKVAKIINFPGYAPDQVRALAQMIKSREQQFDSVDPLRGRTRPKRTLRSLFIGSNAPVGVYDIMPDPAKMQALDYYKVALQGICGVYGVQAIFISFIEGGKAGTTPAMQIEVQNRTIQEIQRDKEEVITEQLFPIFGIMDVKFEFGDLEAKDEMRDAQIEQIKSNTAMTWRNAGFDVKITDEGKLEVTGEVEGAPPMSEVLGGGPTGDTPPKPKESGASRREIEGTTTEREPHGPREATDER